jgi:hypothetical protein
MPRTKAPTSELGGAGIISTFGLIDTHEDTPELRWPNSIHVYDRMRLDAHVASCLAATHLPIERNHWDLDPDSFDGVRPEVIQMVREDLGLAEKGTHLRRPRGGVVFGDYLRHCLLEDVFGHMAFEQVYELHDGKARLRKLAPRLPRTIFGWNLAADGGVASIIQLVPRQNGNWEYVTIPVNRLVVFTRRKEGGDPTGQSILRSAYIHWTMKQALIKVDAIAAERNGMGFTKVKYKPDGMTKKEALDIASNTRTGEYSGVAFEEGMADMELMGVTGQVREILPSIKYHDQEISRLMLAMFLDLGQDNGARSLGETFVDFFVMSLQAAATHIEDVTNEHVIRDLVELNWGPDEPYPLLRCDEITADTDLTAEAIKQLVEAGVIVPDQDLEDFFRNRYGFPSAGTPFPKPDPPPIAPPAPTALPPAPTALSDGTTLEKLQARFEALTAGPRAVPTRLPSGQ